MSCRELFAQVTLAPSRDFGSEGNPLTPFQKDVNTMLTVSRALTLAVAIVASLAIGAVHALHEDEAGPYDWHRPGFGPAAFAVMSQSAMSTRPRP